MLQCFGVANGRLAKQFLKFPTVVERPLHIGHEFIGNIDCEPSSLHPDVQDVAGVLFPLQAGLTVLTNARTPTQTERAQSCRPKICGLILEPPLDFCSRFFWSSHAVCMPYSIRTVKRFRSIHVIAITYEFRDRNYLGNPSTDNSSNCHQPLWIQIFTAVSADYNVGIESNPCYPRASWGA